MATVVAKEQRLQLLNSVVDIFSLCVMMHISFLQLHVSAAIMHNRKVHLRGYASEQIFDGCYTWQATFLGSLY